MSPLVKVAAFLWGVLSLINGVCFLTIANDTINTDWRITLAIFFFLASGYQFLDVFRSKNRSPFG